MVELYVTQMEMTASPSSPPPDLPDGICVSRESPGEDAYFQLYRAVGETLQWDARLRLPVGEAAAIIASPSTHIHVIRISGEPGGFCEFVRVGESDVELAYFGLTPAFYGRRLGGLLLSHALFSCWQNGPKRIWLKTDTHDHPAAVRTYEAAGFRVAARRWEVFPD